MGDAIIKCNLLTTLKGVWPLSRHRGLIVLLLDAVVFATCNFLLFLPYLCSGNIKLLNLVLHMGLLSACVFVFQLLLHTYETLWRYAESLEYLQLFKGLSFGFLLYAAINLLAGMSYVWISGALTGTSIALLIMLAYRFTYRVYRRRVVGTQGHPTARTPTAIIGAGAAAAALLSDLDEQTQGRYRPYCLVDDDPAKQHKRIHGVPVYGPIDDVAEILRDTPVTDIILAIRALTPERRKKFWSFAPKPTAGYICSASRSPPSPSAPAAICLPCARSRSTTCWAGHRCGWTIPISPSSCTARLSSLRAAAAPSARSCAARSQATGPRGSCCSTSRKIPPMSCKTTCSTATVTISRFPSRSRPSETGSASTRSLKNTARRSFSTRRRISMCR